MLNSVLFLLIGLEVLVLRFEPAYASLAVASIPLVLTGRFLAVAIPVSTLRSAQIFAPGTIAVLTWGGLRGGISIALALSLPEVVEKPPLLAATYAVVVFTIVVQGLTLRWLVERVARRPHSNKSAARFLEISCKTIETHRSNIMRKLNLKSTAELVRYGIRNGLIDT